MTKTMTWTGFSPVLIAIWLTVSSKSSLAFSMLLCVVASDSANNKRHKLFFMHKKVINFFNPNFWNFWCLEVRIKSILARNLLIYLDLHCVRRSSWTVTTLATLLGMFPPFLVDNLIILYGITLIRWLYIQVWFKLI